MNRRRRRKWGFRVLNVREGGEGREKGKWEGERKVGGTRWLVAASAHWLCLPFYLFAPPLFIKLLNYMKKRKIFKFF